MAKRGTKRKELLFTLFSYPPLLHYIFLPLFSAKPYPSKEDLLWLCREDVPLTGYSTLLSYGVAKPKQVYAMQVGGKVIVPSPP